MNRLISPKRDIILPRVEDLSLRPHRRLSRVMAYSNDASDKMLTFTGAHYGSTISVCFWVKFNVNTTSMVLVGEYRNPDPSDTWYIMRQSTNKITLKAGSDSYCTYGVFSTGRWYHIAVTNSPGGSCAIYVDGVAQSVTGGARDWSGTDNDFQIGGYPDSQYRLNGAISDLKLFNRVLSASEVRWQMNNEANGTEQGLVGYWRFTNGKDSNAIDGVVRDLSSGRKNGQCIIPASTSPTSQEYYVNDNGGEIALTPNPPENANYVNVQVDDDDATVNEVVFDAVKDFTDYFKLSIIENETKTDSNYKELSADEYLELTEEYAVRPSDSEPWSWSDIENLQIGANLKDGIDRWYKDLYKINYTPTGSGTITNVVIFAKARLVKDGEDNFIGIKFTYIKVTVYYDSVVPAENTSATFVRGANMRSVPAC